MKTQLNPMRSLVPATRVPPFTSFARTTFKAARKGTLFLFAVAVLLTGGTTGMRGQSALDGFDPNATNGSVRAVVVQPDGKILIGGDFTMLSPNGEAAVMRNRMARLNPDGTLDPAFNPNANGTVVSIAVQADGKIVVGGYFNGANSIGGMTGETRNYIARLNPSGTLDLSTPLFAPNATNGVVSIAVQADRKILAGGNFNGLNSIGGMTGETRNYIARLNPDGTLDTTFNPNANSDVQSIVVQANGKILVGGFFNGADSIGGMTGEIRNYIARLNKNGTLDLAFNPNANSTVYSIAVQADGRILAGGAFNDTLGADTIGGQPRNYIARLDATTGSADSFDPNASNFVYAIAVQTDGKILAGGLFTFIGGALRNRIARLDATTDGLADSFNPSANGTVVSIAVQADGKIVAGGEFTTLEPTNGFALPVMRNKIARLETDGRLDQTLDLDSIDGPVFATAVQPDGKILVGGSFTTVFGTVKRNNIARLNTDGTLDPGFNPGTNEEVFSIAVQADGKILIGGDFTTILHLELDGPAGPPDLHVREHIARLTRDGAVDLPFHPYASARINSIAVQADDRILVGGVFTRLASSPGGTLVERQHIGRLEATGEVDLTFDPDVDDEAVRALAVEADNNILVGGGFLFIGDEERHGIARVTPAGAIAPFNPDVNDGVVDAIAVQANRMILIGGKFSTVSSTERHNIARLNQLGMLDPDFDPAADDTVYSLAVPADGKILIGGAFTGLGEPAVVRNHIARLNGMTGLIDSSDPFNPDANNNVHSIAVQADGKILVGGFFTSSGQPSIGGEQRNYFARLTNNIPALQKLTAGQNFFAGNVTWTRGGSSPQFTRVTFEYSTTNVAYAPLGNGTAVGSRWILAGRSLRFPTELNFYIRARGFYRSGQFNGSESITESVRNGFITPQRLTVAPTNLSTRCAILLCCAARDSETGPAGPTGANVGIGGFIITGSAPKHVLIRAVGPSLSDLGVPGALADPVLELHGPDPFATVTNDNWRDDSAQEGQIFATGLPPADEREAAIDATLDPGAYTAVVRGQNGSAGVALVEIYDVDEEPVSKLANLSTRAFVGTGDNILIAGVILGGGDGDGRIVVRGIGPSLAAFGISDALADPTLELRDNNGALLIVNNDWQENPEQAAELVAAGLAPTNQLESGMAATLPPGLYTALLAGLNNGTGVGLVEVYDLGAP